MITNSQIKGGWIARIKSLSNITNLVPAVEVREAEWKGERFTYPNIRVSVGPLLPTTQSSDCRVFSSEVTIAIFVEEKSSKQADDIAGVVAEELWARGFSSNGIKYAGNHLMSIEPAVVPQEDVNSWRSAVILKALVQAG